MTSEPSTVTHPLNPQRYFERADPRLRDEVESDPVCLYLETTNRCNLLCTTCPRTFEDLEPPADMSWDLFVRIVDQLPRIDRVVLHGVGEPMLVPELPRMIRYLKARDTYVLFNTNGTVLTARKGRELIASGLDELRVSLDAAERESFQAVRGRDYFDRIVRNVRAFTTMQQETKATRPRVSLWLTGLKETIDQLEAFVELAHRIGVREVYLQRLVYFAGGQGLATPDQALFESLSATETAHIEAAEATARRLGIDFNASGATEPGTSLTRRTGDQPWSLCRRPSDAHVLHRPWPGHSLLHRAVLDARLRQFHPRQRDAGEPSGDLERRALSAVPAPSAERRSAAVMRELRPEMEFVSGPVRPVVSVVIPALNEEEPIGAVVREVRRQPIGEVIVVDNGSTDATAARAAEAGARIVREPNRGYGRACRAGGAAVRADCDVIVFLDGDGSDCPQFIPALVAPIAAGSHDFVIGSRTRGTAEPGSLTPQQRLAGRVAGTLCRLVYGVGYTDMSPFRAIRSDCLLRLPMREETYGWNLEMQMQAARSGLRILEIPVDHRCRTGGVSKVSGTFVGTIAAAARIGRTFFRITVAGAPTKPSAVGFTSPGEEASPTSRRPDRPARPCGRERCAGALRSGCPLPRCSRHPPRLRIRARRSRCLPTCAELSSNTCAITWSPSTT